MDELEWYCAWCLMANQHAAATVVAVTGDDKWLPIGPGVPALVKAVRDGHSIQTCDREPLPIDAVTAVNGTPVCAIHLEVEWSRAGRL
jgi:hypothetical protein